MSDGPTGRRDAGGQSSVGASLRGALSKLGLKPWLKDAVLPVIKAELDTIPDIRSATERRVRAEFRRLAADDGPIIVGPWLSEVGFELLYWIPFLRRGFAEAGIDPSRVTAVSRGGVSAWYEGIAEHYAEVFDVVTTDEYRNGNERRIEAGGTQKHLSRGAIDDLVLGRVRAADHGLHGAQIVHPSLMYELFMPVWAGILPIDMVMRNIDFRPMPKPARIDSLDLPERYIAAKFYFRSSFADTAENRSAIRGLLARCGDTPIVSLDTGLEVDDHGDLVPEGAQVISLGGTLAASQNLAAQTAVLAHAQALVGTYGGFSYLAPLLGVPALGLYADEGDLLRYHFDVADRMGAALRSLPNASLGADLVPVPVAMTDTLGLLLGGPFSENS